MFPVTPLPNCTVLRKESTSHKNADILKAIFHYVGDYTGLSYR
jgi:hypothetical protein